MIQKRKGENYPMCLFPTLMTIWSRWRLHESVHAVGISASHSLETLLTKHVKDLVEWLADGFDGVGFDHSFFILFFAFAQLFFCVAYFVNCGMLLLPADLVGMYSS